MCSDQLENALMLNVNGVNPPVPDEYDLPQPRHQQWQPYLVEYGLDYFQ